VEIRAERLVELVEVLLVIDGEIRPAFSDSSSVRYSFTETGSLAARSA
jgi:hypothetical protein